MPMMTDTYPAAVLRDTVVQSICLRAKLVRKQMDRPATTEQRARLGGQYDAYVVDLMDVMRSVISRTSRRSGDRHFQVDRDSVESLM